MGEKLHVQGNRRALKRCHEIMIQGMTRRKEEHLRQSWSDCIVKALNNTIRDALYLVQVWRRTQIKLEKWRYSGWDLDRVSKCPKISAAWPPQHLNTSTPRHLSAATSHCINRPIKSNDHWSVFCLVGHKS
ncbi:hypothetical protein E2C01_079547 [Portunus trituberculatus]|uniref:Uncharacterized protein n=1 Tax=Portunus trituberculatus TaxID=210409 RepID=A0A5B7ITM8_PORTR|nr:hypothetical protein [Portunus trituberculatus]